MTAAKTRKPQSLDARRRLLLKSQRRNPAAYSRLQDVDEPDESSQGVRRVAVSLPKLSFLEGAE